MTSTCCFSHAPYNHKILFARSYVNTEQLLYQTMAHELCHASTRATGTHIDRSHGKIYIKTCEKFLEFDLAMDICILPRSSPYFVTFIHECSNEICQSIISSKSPVIECEECKGELIFVLEMVSTNRTMKCRTQRNLQASAEMKRIVLVTS